MYDGSWHACVIFRFESLELWLTMFIYNDSVSFVVIVTCTALCQFLLHTNKKFIQSKPPGNKLVSLSSTNNYSNQLIENFDKIGQIIHKSRNIFNQSPARWNIEIWQHQLCVHIFRELSFTFAPHNGSPPGQKMFGITIFCRENYLKPTLF